MTTYRCKKCPAVNGKSVYHPGMWACPKEPQYDAGKVARYGERRAAARRVMATSTDAPSPPTSPAPGPAPPAATGTPSSPVTPSSGASPLQSIELGSRIAETARRGAEQEAAKDDWLLPAESSETFFGTVRNGLRMFAHWFDDLLEAKKTSEGEIKDSVFEMNSHDLAAARGGFGQRFATKIVKALGARTLEDGIATVDALAFLVMFAGMFLAMIGHFWKVAEESPRLKKLREKAAELRSKRGERRGLEGDKREAIDTTARPAPAAGGG